MENKEKEKKDVKVGAFFRTGCYYSKNRVCHGSHDNYKGFCLLESEGKMYLCDVEEIDISTTDGPGFDLEFCGNYDCIYDIVGGTDINLTYEDEKLHVNCRNVEDCVLINEDGTLSDERFHYDEIMEDIDVTIYKQEYVGWGEYDFEVDIAGGYSEDDFEEYEEEHNSNTIPYGEVNGNIYGKDGKIYVEVYGKVFELDEMLHPKQKDSEIAEDSIALTEKAEMKQEKLENIKELKESVKKAQDLYEQTNNVLSEEQKDIDDKKSEKGIEI